MQMALSRGANGFRGGAGGVDEPARATDVFYGLALSRALVARCSFSPVKDSGMRFAESSPAQLSLYATAKTRPSASRRFNARLSPGNASLLLFQATEERSRTSRSLELRAIFFPRALIAPTELFGSLSVPSNETDALTYAR